MASSISNVSIQNGKNLKASKQSKSGSPSKVQPEIALPILHPKESIGIAAFLGSPIAGGILLAHNLIKMSRMAQAVMVVIGAVIATGCMIAIGIAVPEVIKLGVIMPLAAAMGLKKISEKLLSTEYQLVENGKSKAYSVWVGAGLGLGIAGIMFVLIWMSL